MQQYIENCQKALSKLKEFLEIAKTNDSEYMHAAVIQARELAHQIYNRVADQYYQAFYDALDITTAKYINYSDNA